MRHDLTACVADFPILQRQVHGKRLVYLDSAASSQTPRVVQFFGDLLRARVQQRRPPCRFQALQSVQLVFHHVTTLLGLGQASTHFVRHLRR